MTDREISVVEWAQKDAMRLEACKFAEWMEKNTVAFFDNEGVLKEWELMADEKERDTRHTTAQLYELFKKENV